MSPSVVPASTTAYTYDYLNKGEFRLILICAQRPDDATDIVRCEILPYTLSEPPEYIALSYAWGDVSDKRKILMQRSKMTVSVSASLEAALRALRDPQTATLVWADALSIDQQNPTEKADQVRLMTQIYQKAKSVAIWLGPQSDSSNLGMDLIERVSKGVKMPLEITKRTPAPFSEQHFASVVALFDREYWHRLWVVQEVFNAQTATVHCGPATLPWEAFKTASKVFGENRDILERSFHPGYSNNFYQARYGSYTQVLVHEGPGSLAGVGTQEKFRGDDELPDPIVFSDLLEVMRTCRRKLSSEPKDKVFGVLGVLTERIRKEIKVDYSIPVKDVYVEIFRTVVGKTGSLDIMCDSIHQQYTNNNNLPSWVPDWSHIWWYSPIASSHPFSASEGARVAVDFTERNKLKMSAIPLGSIEEHGTAVPTKCTVNDYLMAFLQWRASLSQFFDGGTEDYMRWMKERFCLALGLRHKLEGKETPGDWMDVCYHVFASTIRDRLPKLHMDDELEQYIHGKFQMDYRERRIFLQKNFGSKMMGRCLCITDERRVGMGTRLMTRGDVVVVPLGCSTPVVLRREGDEYRFIGDVYIHGYMDGRAIEDCDEKPQKRRVRSYVIH